MEIGKGVLDKGDEEHGCLSDDEREEQRDSELKVRAESDEVLRRRKVARDELGVPERMEISKKSPGMMADMELSEPRGTILERSTLTMG